MFDAPASRVDQAIVEIRFEKNYLLWDRAGAIWAAASSRFPGLQVAQAQPNNAVFNHSDGLEFKVEPDKAAFIEVNADKELNHFGQKAEQFLEIVISILGVTEITRAAVRIILYQDHPSLAEATLRLARASRTIGSIPTSIFNVKAPIKDLNITWRQDAEDVGYRASIRSENLEFSFDPPVGVRRHFKPEKKSESRVVLDIDYYTLVPIALTQFKCREWVAQVLKSVRRDVKLIWE